MDEIEGIRQQQTQVNATLFASFLPDLPQRELEAYGEMVVGACERLATWYVAARGRLGRATPPRSSCGWSGSGWSASTHSDPLIDYRQRSVSFPSERCAMGTGVCRERGGAMPDPIEVNYVPDGDDWQVTVTGRGQLLDEHGRRA